MLLYKILSLPFQGNLVEHEVTIAGSLQNGARFGSSIAQIGDINEDGFMGNARRSSCFANSNNLLRFL